MGICVDNVLASVRGVVDLSPHEALDEAQDFLRRQGYSVAYRTTTTLTVKRQVPDSATGQESIFKLIVMALPQSGGGVRIKVRGTNREAVRDHQAAWLEWSETLPKRETEQPEAAATMESVTREIVGQEAPRPTPASGGTVYGPLPADMQRDADRDAIDTQTDVPRSLLDQMRERIKSLERQIEQANERDRENRRIIAALTSRIPAIEAPEAPETPESGEQGEDRGEDAPQQQQAATSRSWWRRWLGG